MTGKYLSRSIIPIALGFVAANVAADEIVTEKEQVIIIKEAPPAPVPAPAEQAAPKPTAPAAIPVAAAPARWYVGGGIGATWLNDAPESIDPNIATEGTVISQDDSDWGWKAFVGYQLHPNFAAELSYVDLGKYNVNHNLAPGTENDTVEPDAWCLSGVGSYPLDGGFSLLGKLGVCRWDDHAGETVAGGAVPDNEGDDGTNLAFGIGASYDLTERVATRLELERYLNVSEDKGDVDMLSLNILYRF
jgi:OOP family OmpA-OmpF porin